MDYSEILYKLQTGKKVPTEGYYKIFDKYSDDMDVLAILSANKGTPLDLKIKVIETSLKKEDYQSVFWGFLLDNSTTPSIILDKMAKKEGVHINFIHSILEHPNVSEETVNYVLRKYVIDKRNPFNSEEIEKWVLESDKLSKENFDILFDLYFTPGGTLKPAYNQTPAVLMLRYYTLLDKKQLDLILNSGMNPSDGINSLRFGLAQTPLIAKKDVGLRLSQVCNHITARQLAQNPLTTEEMLLNIWDITEGIDKLIIEHPNCPKSLKDNFIQHYKENRINKFRGHFKDFENLDLPLAGKTNTDLELLMRLKGHLHNA